MKRLFEKQRDCSHEEWTPWEPHYEGGGKYDLYQFHVCRGCGKTESRDLRNGY